MRSLTIDVGNTATKVKVWDSDEPIYSACMPSADVEGISEVIGRWMPERCAMSCVGAIDARTVESIRMMVRGNLVLLTSSLPLPLKIEYKSRKTLGADRIAAAVGAVRIFPREGVLIADAGSALTLDVVSGDATFRGGNISPGIGMRFRSLHDNTASLPLVSPLGEVPSFGYDTETAIRSGVMEGMAGEIESAWGRAMAGYGVSRLVVTGGDAALVAPMLRQKGMAVDIVPELVERGLLAVLDYNIPEK